MLKKYHLGDFYLVLNTVAGHFDSRTIGGLTKITKGWNFIDHSLYIRYTIV